MTVALALTDLRGVPFTGVRAALSGGNPGHTARLYARRPGQGTGAYTPGGVPDGATDTGADVTADGAGNGVADVPLAAAGVWGLYAVGAATDGPFWGMASAAGDDVYVRAAYGLQCKLLGLGLEGIGEKLRVMIEEAEIDLPGKPCLVLALSRMLETQGAGTNGSDAWIFPVRLSVITAELPNVAGLWQRMLNWRGRLRSAIHNKPLPGVPEVLKVVAEPQFTFPPPPPEALAVTTILTARCHTRIVRE